MIYAYFLFSVHFPPFLVARRGVEPLVVVIRAGRGAAAILTDCPQPKQINT